MRATWWLGLIFASFACARPEMPPGGPEDRLPPIVVSTEPDTFQVVEPGLQEIRFRFSERISERPSDGQMDDAVIVSPSVGNVRVSHGRDGLEVRLQRGLEADQIYRVTVLPVINDMFSNRLQDPFDLVISTGGDFVANVVAGAVEDRVTGRPVDGARVEALFIDGADTIVHWNRSDRDGFYSLRYVPGGAFQLRAWDDRNRDGEVGDTEPQTRFQLGRITEPPDTAFTVLSVIEPDTSRAQLLRVEALDSVTLLFSFDDYLDPEISGAIVSGAVEREGGGDAPSVQAVYHAHEYEALLASLDTTPPPADPSLAPETGPDVGLSGRILPAQTFHVTLDGPLEAGSGYQARLSGVINIAGAPNGGGGALVVWEPPEPDTAAADSAGVEQPADSAGAAAQDSLVADTLRLDTLQVDTLQVDTLQVDGAQADTLQTDTLRADTLQVSTRGTGNAGVGLDSPYRRRAPWEQHD